MTMMSEGRGRAKARRPMGTNRAPVRSVRVSDEVWEAAKRRAAYEGVTMSTVLVEFAEGYAKGLVDRPKVTVTYSPPRAERSA